MEYIDKLCLGTVQFGLNYGISNIRGQIPRGEVFEILNYASYSSVTMLDTAHSYGASETAIGEYLEASAEDFDIVSKSLHLQGKDRFKIEQTFKETLKRLGTRSVYAYMLHNFGDYLKDKSLWKMFRELKADGLVQKIGFSLYNPGELETIYEDGLDFDILQIPYSVFDRRFEPYFSRLKEKYVEIHARSVFLQGLAFMEPDKLGGDLWEAGPVISRLQQISTESGLDIASLCMGNVLLNDSVDKAVIGVDSLQQFKVDVEKVESLDPDYFPTEDLEDLEIEDEGILLPYNWRRI